VDVMLVVGGRNSANTRRLCEISRSLGTETYHIESAEELGEIKVGHGSRMGVAAGASTPGWAIKEVVSKMEEKTVGLNAEAGETTSEQAEPCQCDCDEAEDTAAEVGVTSALEPETQEDGHTDAAGEADAQEAGVEETDAQDEASGADAPNEALGEAASEEPDSQRVADDVESTPEADQVEAPSEPEESRSPDDVATMSRMLGSEYVPQEGEIIRGRVVQVTDDEILVDIGYKSEAVVPKRELSVRSFGHPSEVVSAGDEVYCVVLSVDAEGEGAVVLSKKRADLIRAWERVEEAYSQGQDHRRQGRGCSQGRRDGRHRSERLCACFSNRASSGGKPAVRSWPDFDDEDSRGRKGQEQRCAIAEGSPRGEARSGQSQGLRERQRRRYR